MARVDKTDSAIGVVRGTLAADIAVADLDQVVPCGFDTQGRIVKGAGNTGVKGVMVPSKTVTKAGSRADLFVLADIVEVAGLAAGTSYFADADGDIVTAAEGNTAIGYTVEADRLLIRL
jgi:hypothetical protein